jgi:hypothetical protein
MLTTIILMSAIAAMFTLAAIVDEVARRNCPIPSREAIRRSQVSDAVDRMTG